MNLPEIEEILRSYSIPAALDGLECDGATNVLSQILMAHNIDHRIIVGGLIFDPKPHELLSDSNEPVVILHHWIDIIPKTTGIRIDYKARLWAKNQGAPNGIFMADNFKEFYEAHSEHNMVWWPEIAHILAGVALPKRRPL